MVIYLLCMRKQKNLHDTLRAAITVTSSKYDTVSLVIWLWRHCALNMKHDFNNLTKYNSVTVYCVIVYIYFFYFIF